MRLIDDDLDVAPQINILPMIDVIFSILAFFIISTLFLTRSEGLPVNLPKAATSQLQRTEQITVTIDEAGKVFLNRELIEVDALEKAVRQLVLPNQTSIVTIKADEEVDHGDVVGVMDQLRKIDEVKLAIATKKPK
ncbi:MAG: biopolymer transporter ExbD [Okeania sp. SIO2G4]|uniref:ExbD/TolR family protein n=1 Tax=unclassified Okeania TaxID=2634635 RepID=UPI0013BD19C8|nr:MULTISPECIES: biopolymer transporter ExbD [unclassified Okeania]NEP08345.1 biopolymer transporter ExbD [Okeania sp. SIO4D6]NEP39444.1 biopolymer transporter ExbD [Okeania sp. SIO2H7]NEP72535.1 biopolymer transporter ExbD [Okeania sp. SIO2G5]NEP95491.1 biopolymer transporter ExbD [Okeania sp. SIO2F5]NEQ91244.1 biopolymer transporter ExbD [Okeania sp. SIO2G4]